MNYYVYLYFFHFSVQLFIGEAFLPLPYPGGAVSLCGYSRPWLCISVRVMGM